MGPAAQFPDRLGDRERGTGRSSHSDVADEGFEGGVPVI
jgi:hypothetical protein